MNLDDGARVRDPRDAVERRLGTVIDIHYAPYSTYIQRVQLRFPNGEERTYPAAEVTACSRTDDHSALVIAYTAAARALRDACRIAHDFDQQLSDETARLLLSAVETAAVRLGVILDPTALDEPPATVAIPGIRAEGRS